MKKKTYSLVSIMPCGLTRYSITRYTKKEAQKHLLEMEKEAGSFGSLLTGYRFKIVEN